MSYSIDSAADGCYEGTTCLINKFEVKDEETLEALEAAITLERIAELEVKPIMNTFDVEQYKAIHRFLFEDLFDWAGEFRTVNISKKGTVFADCEQVEILLTNCLKRLSDLNFFCGLPFNRFIDNIVDLYRTTNMIHPFREGNGRTQRVFIAQLIRFNGYEFDFSEIDSDELMIATIHSANGVNDYLKDIFKNNIRKK